MGVVQHPKLRWVAASRLQFRKNNNNNKIKKNNKISLFFNQLIIINGKFSFSIIKTNVISEDFCHIWPFLFKQTVKANGA